LRLNADQPQSEVVAGVCTEPGNACTLAVSETASSAPARFWSASPDGSRALFAVEDNGAESSLYEFDLATHSSSLIAEGVPSAGGTLAGVIGASEDVSRVYFATRKVLAGAGANPLGDLPEAGKPNLYLHENGDFMFIGTLSSLDANPDDSSHANGFSPLIRENKRARDRATKTAARRRRSERDKTDERARKNKKEKKWIGQQS